MNIPKLKPVNEKFVTLKYTVNAIENLHNTMIN